MLKSAAQSTERGAETRPRRSGPYGAVPGREVEPVCDVVDLLVPSQTPLMKLGVNVLVKPKNLQRSSAPPPTYADPTLPEGGGELGEESHSSWFPDTCTRTGSRTERRDSQLQIGRAHV